VVAAFVQKWLLHSPLLRLCVCSTSGKPLLFRQIAVVAAPRCQCCLSALVRDTTELAISDISLEDFIPIKGRFASFVPHTAGRYQRKAFRKTQCPIVERLVNCLMAHGRNSGKKL
jgi:hypothetical protein